MKGIRRPVTAARAGVMLTAALWLLVGVAAAYGSPSAAPANVEPPTATGGARGGGAPPAHNGTWDNAPTTFRYRWLRCNALGNSCVATAADGQTYRLAQV